jgi:hypothetical protein
MKKEFPKNIKLNNGKVFVQRDFYDITEVLDSMSQKLKLHEKKKDFNIMLYWKDFIRANTSELIAKNTFAHRFTKERKLVIGIKSAVIANELQFIKNVIEQEFLKEIAEFDRDVKGLVFELRS